MNVTSLTRELEFEVRNLSYDGNGCSRYYAALEEWEPCAYGYSARVRRTVCSLYKNVYNVGIFIYFMFQASTIDGRRKGACLFCQEYFMDLYLLAELKTISLKVTTVDMQKPPPDFRTNFQATPPPILIDNGDAILENEKIERHIMKNIPGGHNLFVQDKEVATLVENLFSVS